MMVTNLITWVTRFCNKEVSNAPLITFRILFGGLQIFSIIRFAYNGWIDAQYLQSKIYFHYYGFDWIPHPSSTVLYLLFAMMLLASIGITLGFLYRISALAFFLIFTYIELLDSTFYLNHYYFIILVSFLLIFLPANRRLSLDIKLGLANRLEKTPNLYLFLLKAQISVVYIFAGIAKINADWLLRAMPMRIWLVANSNKPVIGFLLAKKWVAYFFAWMGMIYDTTIVLFLQWKKSRWIAYSTVIVFHLLTGWLFPIGVFPLMMISSTLIFFSTEWHEKIITWLEHRLRVQKTSLSIKRANGYKIAFFSIFLLFQVLFPFRYLLYPGNLFWTEEGFRFSWRVMLIEKMGEATFYVKDRNTDRKVIVYNRDHLSSVQEKMMSTQPDFILQYAKYLKEFWKEKGMEDPIVMADIFVTLNGRRSQRFIDPDTDLASLEDTWKHKTWILEN